MKNRIFALILCISMLFLTVGLVSCDSEQTPADITTSGVEGTTSSPSDNTTAGSPDDETSSSPDNTTTMAPEDTTLPESTDTDEPSDTTGAQVDKVEPNDMTFEECFAHSNSYVAKILEKLYSGFMPEEFSDLNFMNGGSVKLYADSLSLLGNQMIANPLYIESSYAAGQNGIIATGELKAAETIGYEIYVSSDAAVHVKLPHYDNTRFLKLDINELISMLEGLGGILPTSEDQILPDDYTSELPELESFLGLLELIMSGELKLIASSAQVSDEFVALTVFGNELQNVRKVKSTYTLSDVFPESSIGKTIDLTYYVYGDQPVRVEYGIFADESYIELYVDMFETDGKLSLAGGFTTKEGELDAIEIISFNGELHDGFANITLGLNENATDTLGGIMVFLGYERKETDNKLSVDYKVGFGASGLGGIILTVPIRAELISNSDGSRNFNLKIDTVASNIPAQFADIRLGVELTLLPESAGTALVFPEFTDENTLSLTDEADAEMLEAYIMGLDEMYPSIRRTIENILEQLGFVFEDEVLPEGTYTNGSVSYTFEGDNVKFSASVLVLTGTYTIDGNTIIFDFGEANSAMNGEYYYSNLGDSIIIGNAEFVKQ